MENDINKAVKVKQKPYKVSERNGYKLITMPRDIPKGTKYHMWRFPDGRIILVPEK